MGLDMYIFKRGCNDEIMYWRKANHIHKWFVDNFQNGIDECQETDISISDLQCLLELCQTALQTRDVTILPPQSGFFFGSTEIDDDYWDNVKLTINCVKKLASDESLKDCELYYQSSW